MPQELNLDVIQQTTTKPLPEKTIPLKTDFFSQKFSEQRASKFKIFLVNMPFADPRTASFSLTLLNGIIGQNDQVDSRILYLNHDFTQYFGQELYDYIANQYASGLGDWIFHQLAFQQVPDNTDKYLKRHYPFNDAKTQAFKKILLEKREGLEPLLERLIDKYQIQQADLLGFSSMFTQNNACFALSKKMKALNPKIITVIGGANCETPMGQEIIKNVEQIDFVFSGPALISFPALIEQLLHQNQAVSYRNINGMFSKTNVNQLTHDTLLGEDLPLDTDIKLDYRSFIETFDVHFPDMTDEKVLPFETSRGCWWGQRSHCTFCGLNTQSLGYRSMSVDVAVRRFEQIFTYANECKHFSAVDNILPKNYIKEVLPRLSPPPDIDIFYEVKSPLKEEEMKILSEKQVRLVQPGIEALNSTTLKLMKKGSSAFFNIDFLKNCCVYGIEPFWNLLVGFPGETAEVFQKYMKDIPLLCHLPPPGDVFPVRFDRYSPYFVKAQEYQLNLHPYDFYKFIYPFPEESLWNIAYYFQDHNHKAPYFTAMLKWLNKLKPLIKNWNERWGDKELLPELYFKDSHLIYDSRFDKPTEIKINETSRKALQVLTKARTIEALAEEMADISGFNPEKELSLLQEQKLIFHEENRYLSLVLPRKGVKLRK